MLPFNDPRLRWAIDLGKAAASAQRRNVALLQLVEQGVRR